MKHVTAWIAGLLFGCGLLLSGMADPAKMLAFFDLTHAWDPSLAFGMAAAIAVSTGAFEWARRRTHSLLGVLLALPTARRVDFRLVRGSLVFGVGWGLGGICPGPGIVLLGGGHAEGLVFVAAMLAGIAAHELRQPQALMRQSVENPPLCVVSRAAGSKA
ncbi:YeeE/YedE family protein [Piscinibacter sp.]|uniref:YeeE/YedE family protein n=1 Tax=Piscinibacter sp. TaxID=1903157 RepID=UPI002C2CF018|nr:YeeE/YedE family protein [Albitalea sp.]HUG22742.1 YeeE/YedE family protein [Albitalea sp.]